MHCLGHHGRCTKWFRNVLNEWLRLPETISHLEGLERRDGKILYVKSVGRE